MQKRKYWIWLSLALGYGTMTPHKLLDAFDFDVEAIYKAKKSDYKKLDLKLRERTLTALCNKSLDEAAVISDWCESHNVGILCYDDKNFPKRLACTPDSPIVLYYIGEVYNFDSMLCLAGVGTREMTRYGHDAAYTFCYDLAKAGAVIVSGLAAGIDTACHRAALDAGGKTVAVLGCRINKVYPAQNRDLMVEIARKGLILTEYHPFYTTNPSNFPKRNRIISGLCQGTIVFEADVASGSLITARKAVSQGRKVFALPGKVGETASLGTNELIRDGAQLIARSADVMEEYADMYQLDIQKSRMFDYSPTASEHDSYGTQKHKEAKPKPEPVSNPKAKEKTEPKTKEKTEPKRDDMPVLGAPEQYLYKLMENGEPLCFDTLDFNEISYGEAMAALTLLEVKGLIKTLPGNKYVKN